MSVSISYDIDRKEAYMVNSTKKTSPMITKKQAKLYEDVFNHYNLELFLSKIPKRCKQGGCLRNSSW